MVELNIPQMLVQASKTDVQVIQMSKASTAAWTQVPGMTALEGLSLGPG